MDDVTKRCGTTASCQSAVETQNAETDVDLTWQTRARGDPLKSEELLVVFRICVWIPDHFFIFFTTAE